MKFRLSKSKNKNQWWEKEYNQCFHNMSIPIDYIKKDLEVEKRIRNIELQIFQRENEYLKCIYNEKYKKILQKSTYKVYSSMKNKSCYTTCLNDKENES